VHVGKVSPVHYGAGIQQNQTFHSILPPVFFQAQAKKPLGIEAKQQKPKKFPAKNM
jgi:hypothetical protein